MTFELHPWEKLDDTQIGKCFVSTNVLAFSHKSCNLIRYVTRHLFRDYKWRLFALDFYAWLLIPWIRPWLHLVVNKTDRTFRLPLQWRCGSLWIILGSYISTDICCAKRVVKYCCHCCQLTKHALCFLSSFSYPNLGTLWQTAWSG